MKNLFYASVLFFFFSTLTPGEIINVPADYSTIQEALNACNPGDTAMVSSGTYFENIVWPSTENIYLVSESGSANTIINGSTPSHPDTGSVIYFFNINSGTVKGFTLKNGTGTLDPVWGRSGGGIFCKGSSPEILDNIIESDSALYGAGISCLDNSSPYIFNNTIKNNKAQQGGGIDCFMNCNPQIIKNVIENNSAIFGGGISCATYSSPLIKNNDIESNIADTSGGGIIVYNYSEANIIYNVIKFNVTTTQFGAGIRCGANLLQPIIHGNTITHNTGEGITCRSSSPIIDSCIIENNSYNGLLCYSNATPQIHYCNIVNNGSLGVRNLDSTVIVNAENNWWGDPTGPVVGVDVSLYVDYEPYLQGPIPVELTSFSATTQIGKVFLHWTTATETNNLGFEIERKIISEGKVEDWYKIGFTPGFGTTTEPKEYSFVDNISELNATALAYRLKQIDFLGSYEYSYEILVTNPARINFALFQNYPNPFNPSTKIVFSVPVKSQVSLKIFNSIGEQVAQLVNEIKPAGRYEVKFNATKLPSGIYFYSLQAGSFVENKKMVLLK